MKTFVLLSAAAALAHGYVADIPKRESLYEPEVGAQWQIVLKKPLNMSVPLVPDVPVWDIDLFDNTAEAMQTLRDAGKKLICYFSAGTVEDWRVDKDDFPAADRGTPLEHWKGERYVNIRSEAVREVMRKRIRLAAEKGCDAIDPDNLDGFENDNGFDLQPADSVDFLKFLAKEALQYNMSTGLKNAVEIIPDVIDVTAFSVNEECANPENKNCGAYHAFIDAGKPVFHIQYPEGVPNIDPAVSGAICSRKGNAAGSEDFSTVLKDLLLKGFVQYCDGSKYETAIQDKFINN